MYLFKCLKASALWGLHHCGDTVFLIMFHRTFWQCQHAAVCFCFVDLLKIQIHLWVFVKKHCNNIWPNKYECFAVSYYLGEHSLLLVKLIMQTELLHYANRRACGSYNISQIVKTFPSVVKPELYFPVNTTAHTFYFEKNMNMNLTSFIFNLWWLNSSNIKTPVRDDLIAKVP